MGSAIAPPAPHTGSAVSSTEGKSASYATGPKVDVPVTNIAAFAFSNPYQHVEHNAYVSPTSGTPNKHHTFDNLKIPLHRASLVNAATGASLTWERIRADSLRVARAIHDLIDVYIEPFDEHGAHHQPFINPRTTVLLCLPNCLPYAPILLGAWSALCTVTALSPMLMPMELARALAKARPQLLFIAAGEEGEGKMQTAIDIILSESDEVLSNLQLDVQREAVAWAREIKQAWQISAQQMYIKGERVPKHSKRIWTVNVGATHAGAADYYGSSARRDDVSALSDPRDWSHLLAAPESHRHAQALDGLERDAFTIKPLSAQEQRRRVALLLWSSGTTGMSKGVMMSHYALVAATQTMWHTDPTLYGPQRHGGEVWIALAPWSHVFGMMVILIPAFAVGATMIIPPAPRFELQSYLQLVKRYGVTQLHVAPPVVVQLRNFVVQQQKLGRLDRSMLASVRRIFAGGAPTPYVAVRGLFNALQTPVHQGYGATETISTCLATAQSYDAHNRRALEEIGSVGMPHVNVELSIHLIPQCSTNEQIAHRRKDILREIETSNADGDGGRPHALHHSVPGEIWVRGPQNMQGYYSGNAAQPLDEETTCAARTPDGWYKTGDEGMIDAHGQLWIVGRLKELIKIKGFQVSPSELDAAFVRHADVADAAAVGVMEEDASEAICMYIEPVEGIKQFILGDASASSQFVAQLAQYAASQLAHYKWPTYFVLCSQITKSLTGKVLRKDLHLIKAKRYKAPRVGASSIKRTARL